MQPLLNKRHWIGLIAIAGLCIATLCGARVWFASSKFTALQILPLAQPLPAFQLYALNSASFTQQQLRGRWSLVFLGFSHCVDICPLELDVIAKVVATLQQGSLDKNTIQGVFITLDPERDSQAVIDTYLAAFNGSATVTRIQGLRGNHTELVKLTHFFGADYNRQLQINGAAINVPAGYAVPLGSEQDYQVNHSARIYLVNPNGQYLGSFPPPHNALQMVDDLQMIIKR